MNFKPVAKHLIMFITWCKYTTEEAQNCNDTIDMKHNSFIILSSQTSSYRERQIYDITEAYLS